jgi:hypothetical protein
MPPSRRVAPKLAEVDSAWRSVMEDAGFIIGSYVVTLATVAFVAWRYVRQGRRLAKQVPDDEKYWL